LHMQFSFSTAFNRFFKLLGSNFVPFALIGIIGLIAPAVALNYAMFTYLGWTRAELAQKMWTMSPENWAWVGGGFVILTLFNLMALSAITEASILRSVDKKVNYGSILGHALLNALPLFIVGFFTTLLVMAGFILLIVPGIIWALCTCVSVPAYVGQRDIGIFGAIGKSFQLTRSHRWALLLLFIVIGLAQMVVGWSFGVASFALPGGVGGTAAVVLSAAINGIDSLIMQIFVAAIYVCLRESKEKLSPTGAAAVFD
ncbi:MAG: hypothetical protein ACXU8U_01390, partial [Asticcacaulis sp.]